jgi:hypothetical protein
MAFTCLNDRAPPPAKGVADPLPLRSLRIPALVLVPGAAWRLIPEVSVELQGPGGG